MHPWESRHGGLGSCIAASSCPVVLRSRLRPSEASPGASVDVIPVYRDFHQLEESKSGAVSNVNQAKKREV